MATHCGAIAVNLRPRGLTVILKGNRHCDKADVSLADKKTGHLQDERSVVLGFWMNPVSVCLCLRLTLACVVFCKRNQPTQFFF